MAERNKIKMIEATREMMFGNNESRFFWREVVNTSVYTMNKVQIRQGTSKTPYELLFAHTALVKHFRIFGIKW